MKTLISPLHQRCEPQSTADQKFVPAITASINEVLVLLSAFTAAAAIVLLSIWVAGLEMSNVLAASTWGVGFIFLGLAVDNRDPRASLQLASGAALLVLAWLQTNISTDYAIVSGVLVAAWVATSLFKQLR